MNKKALTLIELVIVVAILSIIAFIGWHTLFGRSNYRQYYDEQAINQQMQVIETEIRNYQVKTGSYPDKIDTQ